MRITGRVRIRNQLWRYDPTTGFLRCTAVMLQHSVMTYRRDELSVPPEVVPTASTLRILVPQDQIGDPASMTSLEGVPATVGHTWQTAETVEVSVGSVAGAPCFDGQDLTADILVTDREAARRIMLPADDPERLEEISTGFDAQIIWEPGISTPGEFDGYFAQIRYNHVGILPAGHARGGGAVRIVNTSTEPAEMPDIILTRVKLRSGRTIRVHNEDAPLVDDETKATEDEVKNAPDPAKLQELMDKVTELNAQIATATSERDELAGQLQALKEQLEAALNPENVESAAAELAEERDEATAVMNAHGKKLSDDQRKLRGHALRVAVVNSVRAKPLDEAQAANTAFVQGLFTALRDAKPAATVPPAGHQIVNGAPAAPAAPVSQFERLYGVKQGA